MKNIILNSDDISNKIRRIAFEIIENNIDPSFLSMITNKEIFFPMIGFFVILLISFLLRKIYFKK